MLCSRSASLMITTRRSRAIASSILRMLAACCCSLESNSSRSSLVTPSTSSATDGAEVALDVGEGEPGVLHRVVEQRGGERDVVEPELGHDRGHRQRVGDVRLTGLAALVTVGVVGDLVGPGDQRRRRLGVPRPVHLEQRGDLDRGRVTFLRHGSTRSTVAMEQGYEAAESARRSSATTGAVEAGEQRRQRAPELESGAATG